MPAGYLWKAKKGSNPFRTTHVFGGTGTARLVTPGPTWACCSGPPQLSAHSPLVLPVGQADSLSLGPVLPQLPGCRSPQIPSSVEAM